jgi:hypothetical protein
MLTLGGVAGVAVDGLRDVEFPMRPVFTVAFVTAGLLVTSVGVPH